MNWQALWSEGPVTSVHALVAILAMAVDAVQLAAPKGTFRHRWLGFVWLGAMAIVAISSFWIHEFRCWGPFSIIHARSLRELATRAFPIGAIRRGNLVAYRNWMVQLYALALLLAGGFTLVLRRTIQAVLLGRM